MANIEDYCLDFDQDLDFFLKDKFSFNCNYQILSKSLDARSANRGRTPKYNYKIKIYDHEDLEESFTENDIPNNNKELLKNPPIIIGFGPAGLFAALKFVDLGVKPIIFERGENILERIRSVANFWKSGKINPDSNVCFGAGGAGLFSDGKLFTRIRSPHLPYILKRLVQFGAPAEIIYNNPPHIGSNLMPKIISNISRYLEEKGAKIFYKSKVIDFITEEKPSKKIIGIQLASKEKHYSNNIILASGHSADDIYHLLNKHNVKMSLKNFAIGVRIEHRRDYIDQIQYGNFSSNDLLPSANYRLAFTDKKTQRGVYSFCMCPGGYIISSGTKCDGLVINGMSNFRRRGRFSNAALVVSTVPSDFADFLSNSDPNLNSDLSYLKGIKFQEEIEKKAYQISKEFAEKNFKGKALPAIYIDDLLRTTKTITTTQKTITAGICSSPSGIVLVNKKIFSNIFPEFVISSLISGLEHFEKSLKGFSKNALLVAPETKTSSAVTILRDKKTFQSISHNGLYPVGEGAGHAGGITSSAVDGISAAVAITQYF
ncbi:MAG: hypothetical protein HQK51_01640 [Oligoflexia bacterium]|nr:hypothetical protein [Oligoflexia bacterium]